DERSELIEVRIVTGKAHRLVIGPDSENHPTKNRKSKHEPTDENDHGCNEEDRRNEATDNQVAEIDKLLRQPGDGRIVAGNARSAMRHIEHSECDDKGGYLPAGGDQTIDQSAQGTCGNATDQCNRNSTWRGGGVPLS